MDFTMPWEELKRNSRCAADRFIMECPEQAIAHNQIELLCNRPIPTDAVGFALGLSCYSSMRCGFRRLRSQSFWRSVGR